MDVRSAAQSRLIFALDVPSLDAARPLIEQTGRSVGLYKVGLELFIAAGPAIVDAVATLSNADVFLDLKLHDIPATVRAAVRSASMPRVRFVTVHCDQADRLVSPGSTGGPQLLGVTALTSLGPAEIRAAGWYRSGLTLADLVVRRAEVAKAAGCAGVVCSGAEAREIRARFGPAFLVVTPGIRPQWATITGDDQKRATTPTDAISSGADYLVVGRPIRDAKDPAEAADRIVDEIAQALSSNR